jgi:transposase-like protein
MGFLNKLFGRGNTATVDPELEHVQCPHTTLTPSWDSVADMGNQDKVTSYTCQGCNQSFSKAEGDALRHSEAERLQSTVKVDE